MTRKIAVRKMPLALFVLLVFLIAPLTQLRAQDEALDNLRQTGKAFAAVAREASPAVVFIRVEKTADTARDMGPFRFFFGPVPEGQPRAPRRQVGQGSGFIVSPDGYILTNNHVVAGADKVSVKLLDGRELPAEIVGLDKPTDLAVIKIDARDLPTLTLGDSDALEVGEWVLALGNPFGLSHSLTAGIVSAKGRSSIGMNDYEDYIQTDAAINPGNSGGPLINLEGEVVGINTAIYSRSGGYMGIGFAIPASLARDIYPRLVEHGSVTRGYLGVTIQELTPELAATFGLDETSGVLVSEVVPGTPAEDAGLQPGDVIIALDGEPVTAMGALRNRIALNAPGSTIKLTILREGRERRVKVKIGELPAGAAAVTNEPGRVEQLGLSLTPLDAELAARHGYEGQNGLVVTAVDPDGLAARAGIRPDMLLERVDRRAVTTVPELRKLVAAHDERPVLLLVRGDHGSRYVALDLGRE